MNKSETLMQKLRGAKKSSSNSEAKLDDKALLKIVKKQGNILLSVMDALGKVTQGLSTDYANIGGVKPRKSQLDIAVSKIREVRSILAIL